MSPQLDTCLAGGQILCNLIPDIMNTLMIHFNIIPRPPPRHLKRPPIPTLRFPYTVRSLQITTTIVTSHVHLSLHCYWSIARTVHFPRELLLRQFQYMFLFCSQSSRFTLVHKEGQNCRLSPAHGVLKFGLTTTH